MGKAESGCKGLRDDWQRKTNLCNRPIRNLFLAGGKLISRLPAKSKLVIVGGRALAVHSF